MKKKKNISKIKPIILINIFNNNKKKNKIYSRTNNKPKITKTIIKTKKKFKIKICPNNNKPLMKIRQIQFNNHSHQK